jgi:hypothetical protein
VCFGIENCLATSIAPAEQLHKEMKLRIDYCSNL